MPIYIDGQATEIGNVVASSYEHTWVALWPVGTNYFTVVPMPTNPYVRVDWDNPNRSKFRIAHTSICKLTSLIHSVRQHNERSEQLWSGDVVRVRNDYFDDDIAGRKFTYIDATRLKDSFGNLVEVDAGAFIKIGNGRKTEPHPWGGTDLYSLCLAYPDVMPLLDCAYDNGIINESDMPILIEWANNNAPFIL